MDEERGEEGAERVHICEELVGDLGPGGFDYTDLDREDLGSRCFCGQWTAVLGDK